MKISQAAIDAEELAGAVDPNAPMWRVGEQVEIRRPTGKRPYFRIIYWNEHGKRDQTSGGRTLTQAAKKAQIVAKMLASPAGDRQFRTFAEMAHAWLEDREPDWAITYRRLTRGELRRVWLPAFGPVPVASITPVAVTERLGDLSGDSARRHARRCLSALASWGRSMGWLEHGPDFWLPPMPRTAGRARGGRVEAIPADEIPEPAQAAAMAEALRVRGGDGRGGLLWLMAAVTASTGLRLGELMGLAPEQFDLDGGVLRVERQLLETGAFGQPKWGSVRDAVLPTRTLWGDDLATPLRERLAEVEPGGAVFPSPGGMWWDGSNFGRDVFRPTRATCDDWDDRWGWHAFRHAYCSELINARRADPAGVARAVGHSSAAITLKMYSRPSAGSAGRVRAAMDGGR